LVLRFVNFHAVAQSDALRDNMRVPVVNVLDEQVHLKVLDELGLVEGLQEEACVSVPDIGEFFV
jgi:hypothetical protein